MRRFGALLRKEWRDHRALVLLASLLVAAVVIGGRLIFGEAVDSELRTGWMLPGCLVLFLAAVAADSAARESNDGVGDALGRLPVSARALWAAKLVFLMLAAIAFQTWLVALELAVRRIFPEEGPTGLLRPELWAWTAASTGGVFAFAVLLRRSFPGALLGLGTVIGVPLTWPLLPAGTLRDWLLVGIDPWSPAWMAGVIGLAFLLASLGAYSPWCARGNDWARRVLPGLAGLVLVLGPAVGGSAWLASRRMDLVPYEANLVLAAEASPDGRFVVFTPSGRFRSAWREIDGASGQHYLFEVWILDRSDGSLQTIDGRQRRTFSPTSYGWFAGPWGEDGMLRTWSSVGPFMHSVPGRLEVVDPASGTVVSHISDYDAGDRSTFQSEMGLTLWYERESNGRGRVRVHWRGRGKSHSLPREALLAISPEPGVIFHVDDSGNLVRRNLGTGSVRTLMEVEGTSRFVRVSPDGRWLFLRHGRKSVILDSSTGAPLFRSEFYFSPFWSQLPERVCYVRRCRRPSAADASGVVRLAPPPPLSGALASRVRQTSHPLRPPLPPPSGPWSAESWRIGPDSVPASVPAYSYPPPSRSRRTRLYRGKTALSFSRPTFSLTSISPWRSRICSSSSSATATVRARATSSG